MQPQVFRGLHLVAFAQGRFWLTVTVLIWLIFSSENEVKLS
jgi:hypothetical protein